MSMALIPVLSYVLISTFTPGPSNISSASLASLHGYRNTLIYQGGLAAAVFLIMLLSGAISASLLDVFPGLEPVLRYTGAASCASVLSRSANPIPADTSSRLVVSSSEVPAC